MGGRAKTNMRPVESPRREVRRRPLDEYVGVEISESLFGVAARSIGSGVGELPKDEAKKRRYDSQRVGRRGLIRNLVATRRSRREVSSAQGVGRARRTR
jgi:hypothetical protein